jgi:ribosome biogenesis GTPase / thiamine phosphate phosphatase
LTGTISSARSSDTPLLDRLGLAPFRAAFAAHAVAGLEPARVVRTIRGHLWVATETEVTRVSPAGNLLGAGKASSYPVVGDWVAVRPGEVGSPPVVEALLPRRSRFVRGDPGKASVGQVLAANIDVVFIVEALDAEPNLRRIERELALTWESGAVPVVVLSKADLADDPHAAVACVAAIAPGADVVLESAETGEGLAELLARAEGDQTIALIGPSGAGKSSLVNRLVGGDIQKVGAVRASDGRGRHTTVTRELVPLSGGGVLLDTPGLRTVAMWDDDEGVDTTFSEITSLASGCRFDDCSHETEPGCAVLVALEAGELAPDRYAAFIALRQEAAHAARRSEARSRAPEPKRWKNADGSQREAYRKRREG